MTSLLDIGPLTEEVEIRGVKLTVAPLTAGHIFQLFAEFPDMRKLIDSKQGNPQEAMLSLAPDLIAKIIALATEEDPAKRKQAATKAMTMGAADQLNVLSAVQRLSFPDGIAPFVDRVTALMTAAMQAGSPAMTVSPPSSSSTTNSRAPFSASLQTDTPAGMRGHARRAN